MQNSNEHPEKRHMEIEPRKKRKYRGPLIQKYGNISELTQMPGGSGVPEGASGKNHPL